MSENLTQRCHRLIVRKVLDPAQRTLGPWRDQISAALLSSGSNRAAYVFVTLPTRVLTGYASMAAAG